MQASTIADEVIIPIVVEELVVTKREVPREKLRAEKTVTLMVEQVAVSVTEERFEITRTPHHTRVSTRPEVRTEGEVTIVPVVREEAVIEKALFFVEEIQMRRVLETHEEQHEVQLLREQVEISREPA